MRSPTALSLVLLLLAPACKADRVPEKSNEAAADSAVVDVDELPTASGHVQGETLSQRGPFDLFGREDALSGAVAIEAAAIDPQGGTANLELKVEGGKVRAYFGDGGDGYRYVEAAPGKPARVKAVLLTGVTHYTFRLQAVGAPARGVSYHVWRPD